MSDDNGPEYDKDFLCGDLHLTIHCACDLPNVERLRLGAIGKIRGLVDKTDCYIMIRTFDRENPHDCECPGQKRSRADCKEVACKGVWQAKTKTISNNLNPIWEERFVIPLNGPVKAILLCLKDRELAGSNSGFGEAAIKVSEVLARKGVTEQWLQVLPVDKSVRTADTRLCISYTYNDANDFNTTECPYQAFPQRKGNRFIMYNDAHLCKDHPLPTVPTARGPYVPQDCWNDMYNSIKNAQKFIYITGWSVWTSLTMIRPTNESLGDLLKRKAANQVDVRIMVWDDVSSISNRVLQTLHINFASKGMMGTYDEDTKSFFKGSSVKCHLVPCPVRKKHQKGRNSDPLGRLGGEVANSLGKYWAFTHHQKTVICDADGWFGPSGKRKIVAYIGGIDLTAGRFDDSSHPLFSTLQTTHRGDYYNGLAAGFDESVGPREPWHDIHSKVEGPCARDILENFQMRWRKQVKSKEKDKDFSSDASMLKPHEDICNRNTWSIQMFRSIGRKCAIQVRGIDQGIQKAYIYAIRRAQKFIYIENQYFMGSSQHWLMPDGEAKPCANTIPYELAMKVASKIRKGHDFRVYVTIPMWSEGIPESITIQTILFWQSETIKMMYKVIADALRERIKLGPPFDRSGGQVPTDYLQFFCLGNRTLDLSGSIHNPNVNLNALQKKLVEQKRFPIYVHSKLGIFDDEYIIIGSANINQRSMDGARDTEICVGACEDAFLHNRQTGELPKGQVAGFRLSLWGEHMGCFDPIFQQPHTLQCMNYVKQLAYENWECFKSNVPKELPHAHLLPYPISIDSAGEVRPNGMHEDGQYFPDTKAPIIPKITPNVMLELMTT